MLKKLILVVDDEIGVLKFLTANLENNGYRVVTATDGEEAIAAFEANLPHLVILDITMPKIDGFEVCHRIRQWSQVPIIVLSARLDGQDKVKLLDLGADDYITKPFDADELIARVRAVFRRSDSVSRAQSQPALSTGDLKINFSQRRVSLAGAEVPLTPIEYNLLQELALNAGRVLTHRHLLKKIWGPEYGDETHYLHTYIRRIRCKLELSSSAPSYIVTVPGVGYRFQNHI